jgi:hypothetical protein
MLSFKNFKVNQLLDSPVKQVIKKLSDFSPITFYATAL